jgi:hypothetical protein
MHFYTEVGNKASLRDVFFIAANLQKGGSNYERVAEPKGLVL